MTDETMETKDAKEESVDAYADKLKVGENPVGAVGIILAAVYLILLSLFLIYGIIQLWSGDVGKDVTVSILFFAFPLKSEELRIMLITIFAGALGAQIHTLRSFYWYVGNRALVRSWIAMYGLLPFVGSILGLVFYLVIRGGFFSSQSINQETSPFGFAALAAIVGLFSEQAIKKLKEVAETMLAKGEKGEDHAPEKQDSAASEDRQNNE